MSQTHPQLYLTCVNIFSQEHNTCSEIKNTAEAIVKISREALNTVSSPSLSFSSLSSFQL